MAESLSRPRLLQEVMRLSEAYPLDRKLLVCHTPAQGRELLHAAAAAGARCVGWEVTTLRRLAHDLVALEMATAQVCVADEFDVLSLMDEAIDRVVERGAAGPFGSTAGAGGYRDAVRRAVEALRAAGVSPQQVRGARGGGDAKLRALAEVLQEYELLLEQRGRWDGPAVLLAAARALEQGRAAPPEGRLVLVPGHSLRGVAGRLLRLLETQRNTRVLSGDPVFGLEAPRGVLCSGDDVDAGPLSALHAPSRAAAGQRPEVSLFAAATPADELREVLRRVAARGLRWDQVEIVATDPVTYGAALDSLARRLEIPVTYADGLDSRRTRVGRAVEGYFRWIAEGFPSEVLRALLEAGDLEPPRGSEAVSGASLARRLRRLRIGWGQDRYLPTLDRALAAASEPGAPAEGEPEEQRAAGEREARELRALRALLAHVLGATPTLPDRVRTTGTRTSPGAVAQGLLAFLDLVPAGDLAESTVRKMVRDRLERAAATLRRPTGWEAAIAVLRSRLQTRVAPGAEGGLAPWTSTGGRLHLSDIGSGGLACRPFTFVVGLDAGRATGVAGADPLLTDADRHALNEGCPDAVPPLAGSGERSEEARFALAATLARLRGRVTLSYSAWDVAEGRVVSPAPELLQALRLCQGDSTLTYERLREHMGALACAVPDGDGALDGADVWLAALAGGRVMREGGEAVRAAFAGLRRGLHARDQRAGDRVTEYHGRLTPRPELDPRQQTGDVLSATRLEALGTCPRRFLYRYVLGVSPTRDPRWDAEAWLDALERGSLLHRVYERGLRAARERDLPLEDDAFQRVALAILEEEAERVLRRLPAPSAQVMQAELEELRLDVRAWVEMIRRDRPDWVRLELRFGPGHQEVAIPVAGGEVRVQGAIDRVDRVADGVWRIVDYKTGGADGYRPTRPFNGGRRIQHALYALAAERLLGGRVEAAEYHFPTRRGETRVVRYPAETLQRGTEVLSTLFAIAADGHFVATDDAGDCKHCDFAPVCRAETDDYGSVACDLVAWAKTKGASQPEYVRLHSLRELDG